MTRYTDPLGALFHLHAGGSAAYRVDEVDLVACELVALRQFVVESQRHRETPLREEYEPYLTRDTRARLEQEPMLHVFSSPFVVQSRQAGTADIAAACSCWIAPSLTYPARTPTVGTVGCC